MTSLKTGASIQTIKGFVQDVAKILNNTLGMPSSTGGAIQNQEFNVISGIQFGEVVDYPQLVTRYGALG
jgi:hypothetical protein